MKTFSEKISEEIHEHQRKIAELQKLLNLKNTFPDLEEQTNRWNKKFYTSSSINPIANEVEFKHSCGCCSDAALLAFFYTTIGDIRVYANPFSIAIGEQNASGFGEIPDADWQVVLKKHEINPDIVEKVQQYFNNHPPEDYEEEGE